MVAQINRPKKHQSRNFNEWPAAMKSRWEASFSSHEFWRAEFRACIRKFEPSGITHDGSLEDHASRCLAERSELSYTVEDGSCRIQRDFNGQSFIVAFMKDGTDDDGIQFVETYHRMPNPERSEMLGINNPSTYTAAEWEHLTQHKEATGKTKMSAVTDQGVSIGGTDKVKRITWHGHSAFSLARWCGSQGWTSDEAKAAFHALGITMGDTAVVSGVSAGRAGKRGEPANLTPSQAAQMNSAKGNSLTGDDQAAIKTSLTNEPDEQPNDGEPPNTIEPPSQAKSAKQQRVDQVSKAMAARKAAGRK